MTIGFDNKNGYWKSTYGFVTTCFASLNKRFVSFAQILPNANELNICYLHTETSPYNTFLGQSPQSSIIAVSFNDLVSNNKVFKSLSVEGGRIPETTGTVNFFRANSDNTPEKITPSGGRLRDKGGVVYGHIGSISRDTNANVSIVGVVTEVGVVEGGFRTVKVLNADTSNITRDTLFFFMNATDNANYIYGTSPTDDSLTQQGLAAGTIVTYDDMDPNTNIDGWGIESPGGSTNVSLMENNGINLKINSTNAGSFNEYLDGGTIMLFAVTPSNINGEQPKGQYADAWFVLPANGGFELNAINLNYETVSADHSK